MLPKILFLAWTVPLADSILAAAPQRGKVPVPHLSADPAGGCPAPGHGPAAYSPSHQSLQLKTGSSIF